MDSTKEAYLKELPDFEELNLSISQNQSIAENTFYQKIRQIGKKCGEQDRKMTDQDQRLHYANEIVGKYPESFVPYAIFCEGYMEGFEPKQEKATLQEHETEFSPLKTAIKPVISDIEFRIKSYPQRVKLVHESGIFRGISSPPVSIQIPYDEVETYISYSDSSPSHRR